MRELQFIKALINLLTKYEQLHLLEQTTLTNEEIMTLCEPLKFDNARTIEVAMKLYKFLQEAK